LRSRYARRVSPRHAAIGALALGSTLSATAAIAFAKPPAPASQDPTVLRAPALRDARLRFGQAAVAEGRLAEADAGRRLVLQYAARGQRWHSVATTTVPADGRYRLAAHLRSSGALRLLLAPGGAVAASESTPGGGAGATAQSSAAASVRVGARLVVDRRGHDVQTGQAVHVHGTLLPRGGGRHVTVESGVNGRWHVLARSRTRSNGHFDARIVAGQLGTQRLRVRFAGDRRNVDTRAGAGSLRAFRPTLASWYGLYGGALACGGTLGYGTLGVANKTLPCGTKVTLRYRGREVTVPVIDRGPYVGGREWDLTGATARRLGFDGVGVVWSTR
jgi:hypothetical protein